jgi:hypothetical protein
LEDLSIGLTRCERSGQNPRITDVILIIDKLGVDTWLIFSAITKLLEFITYGLDLLT